MGGGGGLGGSGLGGVGGGLGGLGGGPFGRGLGSGGLGWGLGFGDGGCSGGEGQATMAPVTKGIGFRARSALAAQSPRRPATRVVIQILASGYN